MKILALECSAGPSSCALVENDKVLAHEYIHVPLTHSQTLLPMAQRVLRDTGTAVKDIDLFAVSAGPGSFTGVRIGVATIKGLSFGTDIPCAAVSTLAAMAHNAKGLPFDGVICCTMDARCMQVYTACFRCTQGVITRLTEDEAISVEELKTRLLALASRSYWSVTAPKCAISICVKRCPTSAWRHPLSVFKTPSVLRTRPRSWRETDS